MAVLYKIIITSLLLSLVSGKHAFAYSIGNSEHAFRVYFNPEDNTQDLINPQAVYFSPSKGPETKFIVVDLAHNRYKTYFFWGTIVNNQPKVSSRWFTIGCANQNMAYLNLHLKDWSNIYRVSDEYIQFDRNSLLLSRTDLTLLEERGYSNNWESPTQAHLVDIGTVQEAYSLAYRLCLNHLSK